MTRKRASHDAPAPLGVVRMHAARDARPGPLSSTSQKAWPERSLLTHPLLAFG